MLTSKERAALKKATSNLIYSINSPARLCLKTQNEKKMCIQAWSVCFGSRKQVPPWKPNTEHSDSHNPQPENKVWQGILFILMLIILTRFINYTQHKITLTRPPSSISNQDKYLLQRPRGQPSHGAAVMSFHKHCLKGRKKPKINQEIDVWQF